MKKFAKIAVAAALTVCGVLGFAGCDKAEGTLTDAPNKGVVAGVSENVGKYSAIAYYELDRPDDVKIPFETDKIQKVSFKYRVLDSKEYKFKDDTLTVKKSVFKSETAGDKRLRIFVDNQYVEVTVRVVTKVIYNTEDFNSMRSNLNGAYVLGADIDFGNEEFWPIGKSISDKESTATFEGIFDGMGYSVKNITINAYDNGEGEDNLGQGPSLDGNKGENGRNYNNGIFMSTGGSAQIINTNFVNITVNCQGLSGSIAGFNGGLIKNCKVTCTLNTNGDYSERAGGIAGINGSVDANGRIENCIVFYSWTGKVPSRGIADWNSGVIKNSFAALKDDYVFHMGYDSETKSIPEDFDYDEFITLDNFTTYGLGWYTSPAFPGSMGWVDGELKYYKGGDIENSDVVRKEFFLDPANFPEEEGWDKDIWNFTYGAYPSLKTQNR